MLKKLLLILTLFISFSGMSQLSFDTDSAYVTMEPGTEKYCKIYLTNEGTTPAMLEWRLLSSTMKDFGNPDGTWRLGFCDCRQCYSNDFSEVIDTNTCLTPLDTGATKDWYMLVDPGSVSMRNAEWIIEVHNVTEGTYDTLSYFFLPEPSSINKVTVNADVSSYPNPAKDEFIVDYQLTNISTPVLVIYNLVGGRVATYPLNSRTGVQKVNTSEMDNGLYFYTIEENGQRYFTQRFNVIH